MSWVFTPLKNLLPNMPTSSIAVSITRAWEVSTKDASNWEFILIDQEGTQIHGKIPMVIYRTLSPILFEDNHLVVTNFHYTQEEASNNFLPLPQRSCIELGPATIIGPLSSSITFPAQKFTFIDFNDLTSPARQRSYLADVIGALAYVRTSDRKKDLTIYNARNQAIAVTFWDKPADLIPPHPIVDKALILAITSTQLKVTNGFVSLAATKATKIYTNPNVPEAQTLNNSLAEHAAVGPLRRILRSQTVQNLGYIRFMLGRNITEPLTCKATVAEMHRSRGWNYISCSQCKRKLKTKNSRGQSAHNWCEKCGTRVLESEVRLMIHFRIEDTTDTVNDTAFDDVVIDITGSSGDGLLTLENHFGPDAVMNKLDEIVGNEYYLHMKATNYRDADNRRTLTVLAMTPTGSSAHKRTRLSQ